MIKVKRLRTADCVVGGFRDPRPRGSALCCWACRNRKASSIMSASPRRSPMTSGSVDPARLAGAAGFHRPRAGGRAAEMLRSGEWGAAQAGAGGRSAIRPRYQRAVPPRDPALALQAGQAAGTVPDRPDRAPGRERIKQVGFLGPGRCQQQGAVLALALLQPRREFPARKCKKIQAKVLLFPFISFLDLSMGYAEKIKKFSRPSCSRSGCGRTGRQNSRSGPPHVSVSVPYRRKAEKICALRKVKIRG